MKGGTKKHGTPERRDVYELEDCMNESVFNS